MTPRVPRRDATSIALGTLAMAVLPACAATTYDASLATTTTPAGTVADPSPAAPTTSLSARPLGELLTEMRSSMRALDEQVVEGEGDDAALARIEAIWSVAEDKVYDERPDLLFGLQQAVLLARTGVERRRPADASKGYLLVDPLVDDYLAASET